MEVEAFSIEYSVYNSGVDASGGGGFRVPGGGGSVNPDDLGNSDNSSQVIANLMDLEGAYPYRHSLWAIITLVVGYLVIFVVGVAGNSIIVLIVIKTPRMRTVTNYFITNLAFADLLVLIFCLLPTLVSNVYVPWVLGWFLCKTVPYVQGVTVCASVYSLVAISADRYLAIWFPLRCQITKGKARVVILGIWVWSAILALPWLIYFELMAADADQPALLFCVEHWPSPAKGNVYFILVNLVLFYLLPLAIISFCYVCIWFRVWRRPIPNDSHYLSRIELIHQKAKVGVLKMLVFVVFAFILSWLPLYVIFARIKLISIPVAGIEEEIIALAAPIAQWLGASNSCVNPILYAFLNVKFRRAFFLLIRPYKWNRNPTPHYDKPNVLTLRKLHNRLQLEKAIRIHTSVYNMTEL